MLDVIIRNFYSPFLFDLTLPSSLLPFTFSSCLGSIGLLSFLDVSIGSNENEIRFTRLIRTCRALFYDNTLNQSSHFTYLNKQQYYS